MISKFFIERPVLANVLAIVIVLIGGVAAFSLPVAQYPNIVPPTVSVTTNYPGASASTVVNQVALPVELQVNGVEGMIYMQSTSTDTGNYTLTVTFQIGTDLDFAQVLVQNRVSAALASLPQAVQAQGLTVQKKSTSILEIVSLFASKGQYDALYLKGGWTRKRLELKVAGDPFDPGTERQLLTVVGVVVALLAWRLGARRSRD